jgi:hypothetical protein
VVLVIPGEQLALPIALPEGAPAGENLAPRRTASSPIAVRLLVSSWDDGVWLLQVETCGAGVDAPIACWAVSVDYLSGTWRTALRLVAGEGVAELRAAARRCALRHARADRRARIRAMRATAGRPSWVAAAVELVVGGAMPADARLCRSRREAIDAARELGAEAWVGRLRRRRGQAISVLEAIPPAAVRALALSHPCADCGGAITSGRSRRCPTCRDRARDEHFAAVARSRRAVGGA